MKISLGTSMTIATREDVAVDISERDGKFGFWIVMTEHNRHPLVTSEPHFNSEDEARTFANKLIDACRKDWAA